jgi:hypothetical protein
MKELDNMNASSEEKASMGDILQRLADSETRNAQAEYLFG